jgi:CRP-like cAMP-binding protein
VLANIPMFAGLDRSRLKLLSFASERYSYDAGQTVFLQGDTGDKAYVIIEGAADVVLETMDGPKKLVTMERNDLFGELALLCDAPRTATIVAAQNLSLMSISKDVFVKLVAEDVDMSARLTRAVAERLERTTQDLSKASAVRDEVTNLPDARLFADRMRVTMARTKRFEEKSGIVWFDVGNNYDLGADLSEEDKNKLLREIADRIELCTRETDTAARVAPDKFAVIASPVDEERSPELLGQRIIDTLSEAIVIGDRNFVIKPDCEFLFRELDDTDPDGQLAHVQSDNGNRLDIKGSASGQ